MSRYPEIMAAAEPAASTVLIVEDNDVEREGLKAILRQQGFSVREATTGDQALAIVRAQAPSLILLDMLLPETAFDGWAFLHYIRQNLEWSPIPIIIVTGMSIASFEWSSSLGALDIVKKPYDVDELLAKIQKYCAL